MSPSSTPELNRQYQRDWYYRNREKKIALVKQRNENLRLELFKNKGVLCVVCGESELCCLEFHHRDPSTKSFNVGAAFRRGERLANLLAEIEKCDVLCGNCHKKAHAS